jgi:hypothetical protein
LMPIQRRLDGCSEVPDTLPGYRTASHVSADRRRDCYRGLDERQTP